MHDTPNRAFRRASVLAAAAIAAVVLGGLGTSRLASEPDHARLPGAPAGAEPAHAMAAPPQSLAFTADFFAAMGLEARAAVVEAAPAPAAASVPVPCSIGDKQGLAERRPRAASAPSRDRAAADAVPDSMILTTARAAALRPSTPAERASPVFHLE
jgi:hypothetical protein